MTRIAIPIVFSAVLFIACSGNEGDETSGVAPSEPVVDLSASDEEELCAWQVELAGGEGQTFQCDGETFTTDTRAECVLSLSEIDDGCSLTVEEYEACIVSLIEERMSDDCKDGLPSACDVYADCISV
tara:strand:- start:10278 stop:10661 length:384 start_codon:yes stop_codon:yes gene_type:complete